VQLTTDDLELNKKYWCVWASLGFNEAKTVRVTECTCVCRYNKDTWMHMFRLPNGSERTARYFFSTRESAEAYVLSLLDRKAQSFEEQAREIRLLASRANR